MQNRRLEAIKKSEQYFDKDRSQVRTSKKSKEILQRKKKRDGAKAMLPLHERYKKVLEDKEIRLDAMRQVHLED